MTLLPGARMSPSGGIPLVDALPLGLGEAGGVHHPVVGAFEGSAARRGIVVEETFAGLAVAAIEDGLPLFKRRVAVGHDQQRRANAAEADDLHVARILADVGVVEASRYGRTGRVCGRS